MAISTRIENTHYDLTITILSMYIRETLACAYKQSFLNNLNVHVTEFSRWPSHDSCPDYSSTNPITAMKGFLRCVIKPLVSWHHLSGESFKKKKKGRIFSLGSDRKPDRFDTVAGLQMESDMQQGKWTALRS